jgi:1-phosphatidylinositol-3-phosphate 5-kinase
VVDKVTALSLSPNKKFLNFCFSPPLRLQDAAIQSRTHQQKLEQQISIDNGQICTEDLKTDTEEKATAIIVENEPHAESTTEQPATLSENTDGGVMSKVEEVSPQAVISEKDYERPSSDKKLKNLLSQFLLPTGNSHALPSPLPNNHHFLLPLGVMPILVIENDISSVIAYSLMSNDYIKALEALEQDAGASPNTKTKSQDL